MPQAACQDILVHTAMAWAGDRGSHEWRTCGTRLAAWRDMDALGSCCEAQFLPKLPCTAQPLYHVALQLAGERRTRTQGVAGPVE